MTTTTTTRPGERTTWTSRATYRQDSWPEGAWVEEGETYEATVESVHPAPYPELDGWDGLDTSYAVLRLDHGPTIAVDLED